MDYIEIVAQEVRKRYAENVPIRQANCFSETNFPNVNYHELVDALDNAGYIKEKYLRHFSLTDEAFEDFLS